MNKEQMEKKNLELLKQYFLDLDKINRGEMSITDSWARNELVKNNLGLVRQVINKNNFVSNLNSYDDLFVVDIGDSPSTWAMIDVRRKDIKRVIEK